MVVKHNVTVEILYYYSNGSINNVKECRDFILSCNNVKEAKVAEGSGDSTDILVKLYTGDILYLENDMYVIKLGDVGIFMDSPTFKNTFIDHD